MSTTMSGQRGSSARWPTLARWAVGGFFLHSGLTKAMHPEYFLKMIRQYDLIQHHFLLNLTASLLPWLEAFCGLLLLFGVAVRGTALVTSLLLGFFTVLIFSFTVGVRERTGISFCEIKFDCGCGGGETRACEKLLQNCLLLVVSGVLIFLRSTWLSLRFSLGASPRPRTLDPTPS